VQAYPLRWHGRTLGAMNVFRGEAGPQDASTEATGQAFANTATIVIVQPTGQTPEQVTERIQQALDARTIIEQAKGVLAYARELDMSAAYDLLRALAAERQSSLTAIAAGVIARGRQR
jgi:AmiR/NasT family two-component response regulator